MSITTTQIHVGNCPTCGCPVMMEFDFITYLPGHDQRRHFFQGKCFVGDLGDVVVTCICHAKREKERLARKNPDPDVEKGCGTGCGYCGGMGMVDSGGQRPDGSWIDIPCPYCTNHGEKK